MSEAGEGLHEVRALGLQRGAARSLDPRLDPGEAPMAATRAPQAEVPAVECRQRRQGEARAPAAECWRPPEAGAQAPEAECSRRRAWERARASAAEGSRQPEAAARASPWAAAWERE